MWDSGDTSSPSVLCVTTWATALLDVLIRYWQTSGGGLGSWSVGWDWSWHSVKRNPNTNKNIVWRNRSAGNSCPTFILHLNSFMFVFLLGTNSAETQDILIYLHIFTPVFLRKSLMVFSWCNIEPINNKQLFTYQQSTVSSNKFPQTLKIFVDVERQKKLKCYNKELLMFLTWKNKVWMNTYRSWSGPTVMYFSSEFCWRFTGFYFFLQNLI